MGGNATVGFEGPNVGDLVAGDTGVADYVWRLRTLCMLSDEARATARRLTFATVHKNRDG